jgi:hypothetical protein
LLKFIFILASLFTSQEEYELAVRHYKHAPIAHRTYINEIRLNLDTTTADYGTREERVLGIHEGGWTFGLGYERIIYFTTIKGKPHVFCVDHADYSGKEYPISFERED